MLDDINLILTPLKESDKLIENQNINFDNYHNQGYNSDKSTSDNILRGNEFNNSISEFDVIVSSDNEEIVPIIENYNQENIKKNKLCHWAVNYNVLQNAVDGLLEVLRNDFDLDFLPKRCKTLLDLGSSKDEEHHTHPTISCLALIPDIDFVKLFSMDCMHLVCLGITKKLLVLWLGSIVDFARKPRPVKEVLRWKATEFRQFILYIGIIVLKDILPNESYNNFLALCVSMRILLCENNYHCLNFTRELLKYFVESFQYIYGVKYVSQNVHGLLHLCDDYERHGSLNACSTFPFENFMKILKKMIRKHDKPLQQVVRRYTENCNNEIIEINNINKLQFKTKKPDCYALTLKDEIIQITNLKNSIPEKCSIVVDMSVECVPNTCSKAQQTSDLSSNSENKSYKEKSKFKTNLFPPNKSEKSSSYVTKQEDNGPTFPDFDALFLDEELDLDTVVNHTTENCLNTSSNKDINLHEFDESQVSFHVTPSSTKKIKLSFNDVSYPSTPIIKPVMHSESDTKASYKIVNRNIITLKHEVKNIQDRLDTVINMQEKMYEHLCNSLTIVKNNASFDESNNFDIICINNEDDLNIMEHKLTEDESFKKSMIKQLSRLMVQNIPETVRKIMKTLFTDSFLSEFSYIGFKGKNNFSTLKTCKVIFESIRKMKKFSDSTDVEIEKPLKNWMAQATPRIKKTMYGKNDSLNTELLKLN
ncbi:DUF4806 domain-containing protein [Aphis craccivora]|uniref:DUF4806 domain-containing protein n=1 Tax=Aphis craccivora TaxID=307492 RepID=A0A6G0Y094_APHCR|nr:DUF4806 domain-containing protein [Aphis craccivora]